MYFRVLVNMTDSNFKFRTSKINPACILAVVKGVRAGFPTSEGYEVNVLQVTGLPQGAVLSDAQLSEQVTKALAVTEADEF